MHSDKVDVRGCLHLRNSALKHTAVLALLKHPSCCLTINSVWLCRHFQEHNAGAFGQLLGLAEGLKCSLPDNMAQSSGHSFESLPDMKEMQLFWPVLG